MRTFAVFMCISVAFLFLTLSAVRRRVLREQMSVLWILVSLGMIALSFTLPFHLLRPVAHALGIAYTSDLVFLMAVLFLVGLVFQLSITVAGLSAKLVRLTQEVALINNALGRGVAAGAEELPLSQMAERGVPRPVGGPVDRPSIGGSVGAGERT